MEQFITSFIEMSPERQRFTLLLAQAMENVEEMAGMSEDDVSNVLYRMVQAGELQTRRVPQARLDLSRIFSPLLGDVNVVPNATIEQARRLAALRYSLLENGYWSTAAVAEARATTPGNARQWIARHRKANQIFTVTYDGETLVPAFLLNEQLEPRMSAKEPIRLLRGAGEDGWALWAWFISPSPFLGGRIPAEILDSEPDLVERAARDRIAAAA